MLDTISSKLTSERRAFNFEKFWNLYAESVRTKIEKALFNDEFSLRTFSNYCENPADYFLKQDKEFCRRIIDNLLNIKEGDIILFDLDETLIFPAIKKYFGKEVDGEKHKSYIFLVRFCFEYLAKFLKNKIGARLGILSCRGFPDFEKMSGTKEIDGSFLKNRKNLDTKSLRACFNIAEETCREDLIFQISGADKDLELSEDISVVFDRDLVFSLIPFFLFKSNIESLCVDPETIQAMQRKARIRLSVLTYLKIEELEKAREENSFHNIYLVDDVSDYVVSTMIGVEDFKY